MDPNQARNLLWFCNTLIIMAVMGSAGFVLQENQNYKKPEFPEAPPPIKVKKKALEQVFDYAPLWEIQLRPIVEKLPDLPQGPSPYEELSAALIIENTAVSKNKSNSFTTITTKKGGRKSLYYMGDLFALEAPENKQWYRKNAAKKATEDGFVKIAKISEIRDNAVVFDYRAEQVILEVGDGKKGGRNRPGGKGRTGPPAKSTKLKENHWKIAREEKDQVLKDADKYIRNLNMVPYYEKGKVTGFKLKTVPSNSLPFQRGFRPNDVVTRINGMKISSMQQLEEIVKSQKSKRRWSLNLLRSGRAVNMTFDID